MTSKDLLTLNKFFNIDLLLLKKIEKKCLNIFSNYIPL